MKKINLLIVMALATQGSSLAGKTRNPFINKTFNEDKEGFSYSDLVDPYDGDKGESDTEASDNEAVLNQRANKRKKSTNNASVMASISDNKKTTEALNTLANESEIADAQFKDTGRMTTLLQDPRVKVLLFAVVVGGGAALLMNYLPPETIEGIKQYANNSLSEGTREQLKTLMNNPSAVVNTLKEYIVQGAKGLGSQATQAIAGAGNLVGGMSSQVGSGLAGLAGLGSQALAGAGNLVGGMSSQVGSGLAGLAGLGSQALAGAGNLVGGMSSQVGSGLAGLGSQATQAIAGAGNLVGGMSSQVGSGLAGLGYQAAKFVGDKATTAIALAKEIAPDAAKVGVGAVGGAVGGYNFNTLRDWWRGGKKGTAEMPASS